MDLQSTLGSAEQFVKTFFKGLSDDMQMCIQNCVQCSQACEQVIQHCLSMGGMHAEPNHIRLLQDCVDACQFSAKYMIRNSEFHMSSCGVCAEVCIACANDCDRIAGGDEVMKSCAQICRRCAESCQKMSLITH